MARRVSILVQRRSQLSSDIPYVAIKKLTRVDDDVHLAQKAGINYSTLKKAMSGERPATTNTHMAILRLVARNFQQSYDLERWLEEVKWPKYLLNRDIQEVGSLYEELNATANLSFTGKLPLHHIARPALQNQVIEPLLQKGENALNGVVVHGLDGIGKSTLVLAAWLSRSRELIERFGSRIYRLELRSANYEQVLAEQLAPQMNLKTVSQIEMAFRHKAHLLLLDDLDRLEELPRWVRLCGFLNKIIVTTPLLPNPRELSSLALEGVPVPTLNLIEAQSLLEKLTGQPAWTEEQTIFVEIFEALGGLPLVVELLATYQSETRLTWTALKERLWTRNPVAVLDSTPDTFHTIQVCLDLVTEKTFAADPQVGHCFRTLGIFGRSSGFDTWLGSVAGMDAQALDHCLVRLKRLNLVQLFNVDDFRRRWEVHPFVRDAAELALRANPDEFQQIANRYLEQMSAMASEASQSAYGESPDFFMSTLPAKEIMHSWRLGLEIGKIGQVFLSVHDYLGVLLAMGQTEFPKLVLQVLDERLSTAVDVDQRILAYLLEMQGRLEMADSAYSKAQELFLKALDLYSESTFQAGLRINLAYCAFYLEQVDLAVEQAGLAWQMIHCLTPEVQERFWLDYEALGAAILASAQSEIKEPPAVANENVEAGSFLSFVNVLVHQADYWNSIEKFAQALSTLELLETWLHSNEWPLLRAQVWEEMACAQIGLKQFELALRALDAEADCLQNYPDEAVLWAKLWQWRAVCAAETDQRAEACIHLRKSLDCWACVPDSEVNQRHVRKMMAELCG